MSTRVSRTRVVALATPGWLKRQLRRQRFTTAATLFITFLLVPLPFGFIAEVFHSKSAPLVAALNAGLWNSNTIIMLAAAVTLVATILIPTVIATRRDAEYGDGLSEFLENLGALASTAVGLIAILLGWVRFLAMFHNKPLVSPANLTHAGETLCAVLIGALACGLFAANRVDLASVRDSLARDRGELRRLRTLDQQLARHARTDAHNRIQRTSRLWWAIAIGTTLIAVTIFMSLDAWVAAAAATLVFALVVLPLWHSDFGRFPQSRPADGMLGRIAFWVGLLLVVITAQLAVIFDFEFIEYDAGLGIVISLLQVVVPLIAWFALEGDLRRILSSGTRIPLHSDRQRRVLAGKIAWLELGIAQHELLEDRLGQAMRH